MAYYTQPTFGRWCKEGPMPRKTGSAKQLGFNTNCHAQPPSGRWVTEYIAARDLKSDRPIYPGLVEALGRVYSGLVVPEVRRVTVRDLVVSDEGIDPALLADHVAAGGPPTRSIPVVALADGRLWAFDDAYAVSAWQVTAPDLVIEVAVIPAEVQT
jgi:hypothetical protein